MKMSVDVSMEKRQLADARGTLSYAPTLPSAPCSVVLAAQCSVTCSISADGAVATAVPALRTARLKPLCPDAYADYICFCIGMTVGEQCTGCQMVVNSQLQVNQLLP